MFTAVVWIIGFAGIIIEMDTGLTLDDMATAGLTGSVRPTRDINGTVFVVAAAVIDGIWFTTMFKRMSPIDT